MFTFRFINDKYFKLNKEIAFEATGAVIDPRMSVSNIVKSDYRTAPVFRKYNINYCCAGLLPLGDVCSSMGLSEDQVLQDLKEATRNARFQSGMKLHDWKLNFLIDYIINVHHAYLHQALPAIQHALLSFLEQHKEKYPELTDIYLTFNQLSELLIEHNRKEEEVTFPYIRHLDSAFSLEESYAHLLVRTLRRPLSGLYDAHQQIATLLNKIQSLTNNYRIPQNACTNHCVIYGKLHELHDDLVQHEHMEEDILLPRAAELERVLLSKGG